MLKNYYQINEESTVEQFLKQVNEKKNSRYIILEDENSYVDFRDIALSVKNVNEKLKTIKKPLPTCEGKSDCLLKLIESGDLVIKDNNEIFDLSDAYNQILSEEHEFFNKKIVEVDSRAEIFAVHDTDKISAVKSLFKDKKTNLIPVVENLKIVGEIRPMDLLVNSLYDNQNHEKSTYFSEKPEPVMNLPVSNILNSKPITIGKSSTLKETLKLMSDKKLPSIIVTEDNSDNIYSIFSYKDLFRLIRNENRKELYNLEFVGTSNLYSDEVELIEIYARREMDKIVKLSKYNNLKISFKTIGNTLGSHIRKVNIKLLLSHGNHILTVEKQVDSNKFDEDLHSHEKENWNIPKMAQQALKSLETLVKTENKKS